MRSYTGYTSAGSATDALRLDTSVRFLHRLYVGWFDNGRPPTRHYLCAPTKATRLIHSIALIKKDLVRGPTHRSRRSEGLQPRTTDGQANVVEDRPLVGRTRRLVGARCLWLTCRCFIDRPCQGNTRHRSVLCFLTNRWIISQGMSRTTCANSVIFAIEQGGL